MTMREFDLKLFKFIESQQDDHTVLEAFQGLLTMSLNIYMDQFQDKKTDPLTVMTGILEDGIKHYQRHHEALHFGPSPGDA